MLISLLQKQIPFIDVRAPVEFAKGALPTSTNLPILFDEERELVGKAYKKLGGQSATELGHAIVKDKVKEKVKEIEKWISVRKGLNRYPLIRDPKEQELYNNLKYWLEN